MKKASIKPLTYGMVTMSSERTTDAPYWRDSCYAYSEKQDAVFWQIRERSFCAFIEDGIPRIERIGKMILPEGKEFIVVFLDIEEMVFRKMPKKSYKNNERGLRKAKEDFKNGILSGMFLTNDVILIEDDKSKNLNTN